MKPAALEYDDPETLVEALDLLAEHGDEAKVLAGGQSLVPLLNFRLARPERLIDVNRVPGLAGVRVESGSLRLGAMTRQTALVRSAEAAAAVPLLVEAVHLVAHEQIRNRGTVGGSAAHGDPAAELPVAFAALDARFHLLSKSGVRSVEAPEFFRTHLTTVLAPDELLVEIEVPLPAPGAGYAFVEFARRAGDFALGGAAVLVSLAPGGTCESAAIALLGCASTPLRRPEVEAWLGGQKLDERTCEEAAKRALSDLRPTGDIHGSSEYRRALVQKLVRDALLQAAARASAAA